MYLKRRKGKMNTHAKCMENILGYKKAMKNCGKNGKGAKI